MRCSRGLKVIPRYNTHTGPAGIVKKKIKRTFWGWGPGLTLQTQVSPKSKITKNDLYLPHSKPLDFLSLLMHIKPLPEAPPKF